MPSFDFLPILLWGLPLAALPLVIHLINLLKHRDVRWAAMEFLIASRKKYRTRVILKQILLLALRTAAVVGLVCMLAQPRLTTALGQLLGGPQATHVVLLDDSFSMADGSGGRSCFARGLAVSERLCREIASAAGTQEIAVGRFSRLAMREGDAGFDVERQPLSPDRLQPIVELLQALDVSQADAGPREAIERAAEIFGESGGRGVVWIVSDFRARNWRTAEETAASMKALADAGVQLRLVDCGVQNAAEESPNLSIEKLELSCGVPAAGVVLPMEVSIRNHSGKESAGVEIEVEEDGVARPGVRLEGIPPGGTASRRIDVRFPETGGHSIVARIPADAVAADNTRTAVIDVVEACDVLLIDGALAKAASTAASRAGDAFYLSAALSPGSGAPTGLNPRIEPPRSLATLDLAGFDCIYLLDVDRLDAAEVRAVENYARSGGGVVFFMGPRSDPEFLTTALYRQGEGIFPVPVAGAVDLLPDPNGRSPDVVVEDHPVVAVLSGQRNPLLDAVRIERSMAVERGFEPPPGSGLRRLLGLRSGQPLVVEKPFGDGMVVAVLSTAAPTWNNWARGNPSWVVVMLELESHLARARAKAAQLSVGDPFEVVLQSGSDEIDVDFVLPGAGSVVHALAEPGPDGRLTAVLDTTWTAGSYAARWKRADGTEREKVVAVNVNPDEGSLERIGRERLANTLAGVPHRLDAAESLEPESGSLAGASLVTPLIYGLLLLLLLEQFVAYSASYHLPSRAPAKPWSGSGG